MTENDRGDLYRVIWNCYSLPTMTISQLSTQAGTALAAAVASLAASQNARPAPADFCVVASRKFGIQLNLARSCIAVRQCSSFLGLTGAFSLQLSETTRYSGRVVYLVILCILPTF